MQSLPRLYKIKKESILDPGATRHQQAGTASVLSLASITKKLLNIKAT
jgi:hypothetical protein